MQSRYVGPASNLAEFSGTACHKIYVFVQPLHYLSSCLYSIILCRGCYGQQPAETSWHTSSCLNEVVDEKGMRMYQGHTTHLQNVIVILLLYFWPRQNQRMAPAQRYCAGFRNFSRKKFMHRVRAARPRGFDSLPSLSLSTPFTTSHEVSTRHRRGGTRFKAIILSGYFLELDTARSAGIPTGPICGFLLD